MIAIIHGDNIASSRKLYLSKKEAAQDSVTFRGGEFSLTDLIQAVDGGGLFIEEKNIFIEELFGRVKSKNELEAITAHLESSGKTHSITLWEGKVLTKTQLGYLPSARIEALKLPTSLFLFLDSILPGNSRKLLTLYKQTAAEVGDEMVFAMLVRQIRILLAVKMGSGIDETKRLASWQKERLVKQSSAFTRTQLIHLHRELFTIDYQRKTGTSTTTLQSSIDFFLASLYH